MANILYIAALTALIVSSLVFPALVWWCGLAAVVATAAWYYFRLRDAELERRSDGVADLDD